jgi:branched-chain amino acid transport system permease protein
MAFTDLVLTALTLGGFYALISIGLNLQYGVARILNLSYGELMMLAAFGTFWVFSLLEFSPFVSLAVGAPVAFAFNYLLFQIIFRPLVRRAPNTGALEVNAILSTFGLLFVLQGIALVLWGGSDRAYSFMAEPVEILGAIIGQNRLVAMLAAIGIAAVVFVFLEFTRVGRALRAISSNAGAAPLAGIDVERYSAYAFAVGGVLAAAAGVLISSFISINPTIGAEYTMKALIVITMGGIGHVFGGLVAGLALGFAETLCAEYIDSGLVTAINFVLFITVLIVRPQGLFGKANR